MNTDTELLERVTQKKDFFRSILEDALDDWSLAKDYGEYLIRVTPRLLIGHLILARACRHLGDRQRAIREVELCHSMAATGDLSGEQAFVPDLLEEEQRLSSGG